MDNNQTPKKHYFKGSTQTASSLCPICLKVCDPKNAKNIFHRGNSQVLAIAEELLRETFERQENLPH